MMLLNRRIFLKKSLLVGLSLSTTPTPWFTANRNRKGIISNPFFVFENGVKVEKHGPSKKHISLVRELGYDGMEKNGLEGLKETNRILAAKGLRLFTTYVSIDLENSDQPYPKELEKMLAFMGDKDIMPWLYFPSPNKLYPPSSAQHDETVVSILRQLADLAALYQVKLILYPHMWFWIESVDDAVRIARKVNRPNLGITFNLCHYLAHCHFQQHNAWQKLETLAKEAYPYIFAMSINGADQKPKNLENIWESFIQPLGKGDFDTYAFLKIFLDKGFRGPIGLQCYNISQPAEEHLKQSMNTWQLYKKRYKSSTNQLYQN